MNNLLTRVFTNGDNQTVRIPAEFRFDTDHVQIFRTEQGDLVLHPLRNGRGSALLQALQSFKSVNSSLIPALEAEHAAPLPMQDREAL